MPGDTEGDAARLAAAQPPPIGGQGTPRGTRRRHTRGACECGAHVRACVCTHVRHPAIQVSSLTEGGTVLVVAWRVDMHIDWCEACRLVRGVCDPQQTMTRSAANATAIISCRCVCGPAMPMAMLTAKSAQYQRASYTVHATSQMSSIGTHLGWMTTVTDLLRNLYTFGRDPFCGCKSPHGTKKIFEEVLKTSHKSNLAPTQHIGSQHGRAGASIGTADSPRRPRPTQL